MRKKNKRQADCSAFWLKGIADTLERAGLDVPALFAEAGLDWAALTDPDARFSGEKISLLWQLAVARSGNPAIALANWDGVRPAAFDVVAYAMMSSPNLLGLLRRMVRYAHIVSNTATLTVIEDSEGYRLTVELFNLERPAPRQRFEFFFVTFLSFCRWVTDRDLRPLALELSFPSPTELRPYQDAFKCPLRFDAAANALLFARADAAIALPTYHPLLAEVHERLAGEQLRRIHRGDLSSRAHAVIIRRLHDGAPPRAEIASALGIGERTLQRRLAVEGTSFRRLLDDTRRRLAEQYLGQRDLSLAGIAYRLGFGDQRSFFRASKRWFGRSPRGYGTRLMRMRRAGS